VPYHTRQQDCAKKEYMIEASLVGNSSKNGLDQTPHKLTDSQGKADRDNTQTRNLIQQQMAFIEVLRRNVLSVQMMETHLFSSYHLAHVPHNNPGPAL
jgi:hypothetical protein